MPEPKNLKTRLNGLLVFNPSRWPYREALSRMTALVIIGVFLTLRIYHFDRFPQSPAAAIQFYSSFQTAAGAPLYSTVEIWTIWAIKLAVWLIETGIFLAYIAAYIGRAGARSVAAGFMETAFPVIVAGIPVLIAMTPYNLPRRLPVDTPAHIWFYLSIMSLIVIGGLINLIGLIHLRRAFTIMSEARVLITAGLFRHIRHPLYTGHFVMFLGSLLLRLHVYTVIMYMVFCIGQVARARIEERKLVQVFPEYTAYKHRTGMFLPNLRRFKP